MENEKKMNPTGMAVALGACLGMVFGKFVLGGAALGLIVGAVAGFLYSKGNIKKSEQ